MAKWTLHDIPWDKFDASKIDPDLISLAKTASLVEYNAADYSDYLHKVFPDDPEFGPAIDLWAEEERQHGLALKTWAEMADPTFNFDESFRMFTEGFSLPQNVDSSVRGSRAGELIARCVVETGTSSYYTAIKEYTDEPALKAIAAKIAADELRHYKLFYDHLKRYLEKEPIPFITRFKVALGRILESEDDELAYAYYASHHRDYPKYDRKIAIDAYSAKAYRFYRRDHVDKMTGMIFKAIGLKPHGMVNKTVNHLAWRVLKNKAA